MSATNPLSAAAERIGTSNPLPRTDLRLVDNDLTPSPSANDRRITDLEFERDANRELVANAASVKAQRNVAIAVAAVFAVMWWRAR